MILRPPTKVGGLFFVYGKTSVMHLIYKPLFMEPNQIKEAHILDILFDGRNKEYGAYELRMTYNRRVVKSIIVMGSVVILAFVGSAVSGLGKAKRGARIDVGGDV